MLTDQLSLGDADSKAAEEESCCLKTQTGNACSRRDCALAPPKAKRVCEDIQYLRLVSAWSPAENSFFQLYETSEIRKLAIHAHLTTFYVSEV